MGKLKIWLMLTLCNLFWAGNYVFGKYVVGELTPLWITFIRWMVASVLLLFVAHYLEKPDFKAVLKSSWPILMVLGILGLIGYNTVLYSALEHTSSMNASLVNSLNPSIIAITSIFLLKEKISKYQIVGFVTSLLGVVVILTDGNVGKIFTTSFNKGDLLMLVAITLWTFYSIIGKRLTGVPPITATAISAVFSTLIMAPFVIVQGIDITGLSSLAYAGLIYIILFPSIGSFVFWNVSVREIGASKAGIFLNLMPVFTAIISWSLGEKITGTQIYGGLLVLVGVIFTTGMVEGIISKGIGNKKKEVN